MNIVKATQRYEEWLGRHTKLVKPDLLLKHQRMVEAVFPFLRATFYRWMQIWPEVCPDLAKASQVLAVGDLHVENFGTWRDIEGRLIRGVHHFDEAWPMTYTIDLVRLAVSAHLAVEAGNLPLKCEDICGAMLEGYHESIQEQGCAFGRGEKHQWLRLVAEGELRDPVRFRQKRTRFPLSKPKLP